MRAAIETIAELGYDKATFARITERAALSSPRMISYHFADKNDLQRANLESNLRFLRDHPKEIVALTEIGPHLRTLSGEGYTSTTSQDFSVTGLAELLVSGQESGEFRSFDGRADPRRRRRGRATRA